MMSWWNTVSIRVFAVWIGIDHESARTTTGENSHCGGCSRVDALQLQLRELSRVRCPRGRTLDGHCN